MVSIALSLVLLAAAAMKGKQLATSLAPETSLFTTRWFLVGVVECELAFALWLLRGLFPRQTRLAAMAYFTGLASVSLYRGLTGALSCGCFGDAPVNPWLVGAMDLAAIAALAFTRPVAVANRDTVRSPAAARRVGAVAGAALLLAVPAALTEGNQVAQMSGDGVIVAGGGAVLLDPVRWVGNRFPLLKQVEIGDDLTTGVWRVVLHRRNCPECERALAYYRQNATRRNGPAARSRIALVELPPFTGRPELVDTNQNGLVRGRLGAVRDWLVETPVELTLKDGIVIAVKDSPQIMGHAGSGAIEFGGARG
ncbi:MAG TPA: MauE/DoxX family redox-associated membrane protein [Pirellulales bacterium]|nr:MauE/DoxX family redox-associated membrane protein [Pirellulales bacterium]